MYFAASLDITITRFVFSCRVHGKSKSPSPSYSLVPELEFRHWKKNGSNLLSYPVGVAFSTKYSKVFVTDRLRHSVYMVDLHCPSNVTLVAGGVEPGYSNGSGRKARFSNPAGVVHSAYAILKQSKIMNIDVYM